MWKYTGKSVINKRGILIENVLGLIIAGVGIGLLILGAVKLYDVFVSQESENAKRTINVIESKIENLKEGETGRFSIVGVEGWFLAGWGKNDKNRPDKCFFNSCICICPSGRDAKGICQTKGFCREFDFDNVGVFEFWKVTNRMNVNEEDVVKDIFNPIYYNYGVRGKWVKEGIYDVPLLDNACPQFYESNLAEILIHKDKKSLGILKINEKMNELDGFEIKLCNK